MSYNIEAFEAHNGKKSNRVTQADFDAYCEANPEFWPEFLRSATITIAIFGKPDIATVFDYYKNKSPHWANSSRGERPKQNYCPWMARRFNAEIGHQFGTLPTRTELA